MVVIMCQEAHPRQPSPEPKCACLGDPGEYLFFESFLLLSPSSEWPGVRWEQQVMPLPTTGSGWFNPGWRP